MKICAHCSERFSSDGWKCPNCYNEPVIISGHPAFAPELHEDYSVFNSESFEKLFHIEPLNFWFRSRNSLILWAIQKYFKGAKKILEVGCGTGFVLSGIEQTFPTLSLFGSEIQSIGLKFASKRLKKAKLLQVDARKIPFEDEFDLIGSFDVIEHIKEDELVLTQLYKACKQGGGIIITVPQHKFLWSSIDDYSHHFRRYSHNDIVKKTIAAGFKTVRVTSFVSLLLPLMIIARILKKNKAKTEPEAEFRMGKTANYILEKIMDIERFLIRIGADFTCGGSLLIIARKY